MGKLGSFFEKAVKVTGTVTKVGVQLGAELAGTIAEKIDDDPEVKKKFIDYGKAKGQAIKEKTTYIASKTSEAVDQAVDVSVSAIKEGSTIAKEGVNILFSDLDRRINEADEKRMNAEARKRVEKMMEEMSAQETQNEQPAYESKTFESNKNVDKKDITYIFSERVKFEEENVVLQPLSSETQNEIDQFITIFSKELIKAGKEAVLGTYEEVLNKKKEREVTTEAYEIALRRNIIFFMYKWGYTKKLIKHWIDNNCIPDIEQAESQLEKLRDKCIVDKVGSNFVLKNGSYIQSEVFAVMKKFDKYEPLAKRIEELEFSYIFSAVRDDIIFNLAANIAGNKKIADTVFVGLNSDTVVQLIEKRILFYTNVAIGNLKLNI